jgi:heme oxygenase
MNEQETAKAIMLVALLHNCQSLLDELPVKSEFKHKLKYTSKNFSNELDNFITQFYSNMDEDANLEYNKRLKTFETYIDEILNGNVLVLNN